MERAPGQLWVVATPIGNLEDLAPRAVETLRRVDVVLAEDTRVTRRLLDAHAISTPMSSLHDHNETRASAGLVARMLAGASLALVSDAGTPLLSDPGFELVRAVQAAGLVVHAVPGPSAVTAALSVAGMPARPFWFEGFLPPRARARRERLEALSGLAATLVFFEAPHRVRESVRDMVQVLGEAREAAFARELTKRHEEVRRDRLDALAAHLDEVEPRGEYVLLVAGAGERREHDDEALARVLRCLLPRLPTREAASAAAEITGARRNQAYALALRMRAAPDDPAAPH